jgi:hypothetical protein
VTVETTGPFSVALCLNCEVNKMIIALISLSVAAHSLMVLYTAVTRSSSSLLLLWLSSLLLYDFHLHAVLREAHNRDTVSLNGDLHHRLVPLALICPLCCHFLYDIVYYGIVGSVLPN